MYQQATSAIQLKKNPMQQVAGLCATPRCWCTTHPVTHSRVQHQPLHLVAAFNELLYCCYLFKLLSVNDDGGCNANTAWNKLFRSGRRQAGWLAVHLIVVLLGLLLSPTLLPHASHTVKLVLKLLLLPGRLAG